MSEIFKTGILEPEDFSPKAINEIGQLGTVELFDAAGAKDEELRERIADFIEDKTAVFIRLAHYIDDELIKNARDLKYICSPTTGLNHINVTRPGVQVISLKGEYEFLSSIRATPEHVFGMSLGLLINYSHAFLNENNTVWDRDLYKGYEIYGPNIGIIGLGRVGKIIAGYFEAFGANVHYYDTTSYPEYESRYDKRNTLTDLIDIADMVILCVNYTPENENMIGAYEFACMDGKYFINAARGELVSEEALIMALKTNTLKGAAIDVLKDEAHGDNKLDELIALQKKHNLIITPHIGGATYTSMQRTEEFIAGKLKKEVVNKQ